MLALRLVRLASIPEMPVLAAAFAVVVGTLFVLAGIKGLKIKSLRDVEAELEALRTRRDRLERAINK
jgi:hypothetical protein